MPGGPDRVAGRLERPVRRPAYEREAPGFPEYDRRGRMAAADPVKDGEFLDRVRKRAEAQRTAYEAEKLQDPESGATGG